MGGWGGGGEVGVVLWEGGDSEREDDECGGMTEWGGGEEGGWGREEERVLGGGEEGGWDCGEEGDGEEGE